MSQNPKAWSQGAESNFRPEQIELAFERNVLPPIISLEDLLVEMKRDGNKEQFQALRAALK